MYYYLYKITNLLNNKVYIGQSNKEKERWRQHKYFGRNPEKTGQYIHRAMYKCGVENFIYEVIAMCLTSEGANETEKILINQYNSQDNKYGYNIALGGDSPWNRGLPSEQQPMYGKHHSEESKKKISDSNIGIKKDPHTDEWKKDCSNWLRNRVVTDETKKKMSDAGKRKKFTEQQKDYLRTMRLGTTHSKESKDKMSKSHLGKIKTEQTKRKMSEAKNGSNNNLAKLSWEIVNLIRSDYATGLFTHKQLAEKYNITSSNICMIVNYKTWRINDKII